jgi:hypothetical protein
MSIEAPFTPEQVKALNNYQHLQRFHPFTCINQHDSEAERILVADADGWHCPTCDYRQAWAHPSMVELGSRP